MIYSMTGYGSGQAQGEIGSVSIEIRSVNSRYLDLSCRIPEELRQAEMLIRELVSRTLVRGKVEVRASYTRAVTQSEQCISESTIEAVNEAYHRACKIIHELQPPAFSDLLQWPDPGRSTTDQTLWVALCQKACEDALAQLQDNRLREGERLVSLVSALADDAESIVASLEERLPELMQMQQERLVARMREVLEQVMPTTTLTAAEFSERINAEVSLFALRADVAEELGRLRSHLKELRDILQGTQGSNARGKGHGKRLDFLFQEMNREANTLGSKAVHLDMTRASIDLKLIIEQMREQIQNIE